MMFASDRAEIADELLANILSNLCNLWRKTPASDGAEIAD